MNTNSRFRELGTLLGILLAFALSAAGQEHGHDHDHHQGDTHVYEGARAYYLAEHGDFEIGYEDGELELHIHLHAGTVVDGNALDEDTVFEPDQLTVVATEEAEILRPAGELWGPTGVDVNEPLWVLPQHEKEGLPAYGFSTEEILPGIFVDDLVQLNLRYVKGPGDFSLWESDSFGLPTFILSSHDGLNSAAFPVGLHAHYNWGFTVPGDYTLVFEATGELVGGGQVEVLSIYNFKVIEQSLCLKHLPADVNGDCVVDEHDLHIVEDNLGQTAPTWPVNHAHDHDDHKHGADV